MVTRLDELPKKVQKALRRAIARSTTEIQLLSDTTIKEIEFNAVYRVSYDKESGDIYRMYQVK